MRVAVIAYHFAEYAFRLAEALAEQHEVMLFMHRENAESELGGVACREKLPFRIVLQEKRGPKAPLFFRNILQLAQEIKAFSPGVIHYQESLNYAFTLARPLFRRVPLVITIHDHIAHSGAQQGTLAQLHRRFLRTLPDAVIVHGEKIKSESEALLPRLRGCIFPVPHGPLGCVNAPVGENWENGSLLFFGRIEQYKGLGYLIEATKLLHREGVPVRTVIAGRGTDLDVWRDKIRSAPALFDLQERFIAPDEVQGLFARANCVVLPYTDATQSGIAAMALQYGRPVVATEVGSIGDMVRNGYNGILVPPRDASALAVAIRTVVKDQELARQMGRNALQLGHGELSWPEIAGRTTEVYEFAVERKPRAGILN